LTEAREVSLLGKGASLPDAVTQAEAEFLVALNIGGPGFKPGAQGNQLNILGGDDDRSAYLLALSSVFAYAAADLSPGNGSADAKLQALINTTQAAFMATGTVPTATTTLVQRAQQCVEPDDVTSKLTAYVDTLGVTPAPTVPNINRALDSDLDGVPNLTDNCPLVPNPPGSDGGTQPTVNGICQYRHQSLGASTLTAGKQLLIEGDVDGKNGPDIVAFDSLRPTKIEAWLNDGTGRFGSNIETDATGLSSFAARIGSTAALGDIDGDSIADLVLSGLSVPSGAWGIVYLPGDGQGHFGAAVRLFCFGWSDPSDGGWGDCTNTYASPPVVLRDLDGNGRLDLVGVGWTALALGSRSWSAPVVLPDIPPTGALDGPWVGDWNGDGKVDVVLTGASGVYEFPGDGTGNFASPTVETKLGFDFLGIAGGDIDGDGHIDLVAGQSAGGLVSLVVGFGAGDGTISDVVTVLPETGAKQPLTAPAGCASPTLFATSGTNGSLYSFGFGVGDLTGDGKADIYLMSPGWAYVSQGRTFAAPTQIAAPSYANVSFLNTSVGTPITPYVLYPLVPLVADLNGDGIADIVVPSGTTGIIAQVSLMNPANGHSW
jgi:hypothetical protein